MIKLKEPIYNHVLSSALINAIGLILGFVQGIVIARNFGAIGKGEIAFFLSIFSMLFAFSSLGIKQSTSFYLKNIKISIWELRILTLISFILFLFLFFLAYIIQGIDYNYIFLWIILHAIFSIYVDVFSSIPLSKRDIDKINIIRIISSVTIFAGILFCFYFKSIKSVQIYFLIYAISSFSCSIYVYLLIERKLKKEFLNISFTKLKKIINKGIQYCIPLFIMGLNFKIDLIILEKFVKIEDVGIYSVGVSYAEMIWQIPSVLTLVIFSYSVSEKNPLEFSRKTFKKTKKLMLYLIPVLIIYSLVLIYFIPFFYGSEFNYSPFISIILMPGTYFIIAYVTLNSDLAGKGYPLTGAKVFTLGVVLNIVLNVLLIPKLGINGSAISSTISYIICTIIFINIYQNKISSLYET